MREGAIAAALTALMILLFLGSWRSTLVVMISIPARDPLFSRRALFPRRDAQHHDARRPCAGGRHSGRRFHCHHRKHAPAADRRRQCRFRRPRCMARPALPCRRWSRRSPSLRVHFRRLPSRTGQISVHAARFCRGVCHARLLRIVADADAGHHRPCFSRESTTDPAPRLPGYLRGSMAASSEVSNVCGKPMSAF